jgi:transcriptional regulator with XRE-family HTH domain
MTSHPPPPHFIKHWRKFRGLTQAALATAMGVDRTLITKLETFSHRYNQDVLESAAKALDCQPWELLVRDPQDDPFGLWAAADRLSADSLRTLATVAQSLPAKMSQ